MIMKDTWKPFVVFEISLLWEPKESENTVSSLQVWWICVISPTWRKYLLVRHLTGHYHWLSIVNIVSYISIRFQVGRVASDYNQCCIFSPLFKWYYYHQNRASHYPTPGSRDHVISFVSAIFQPVIGCGHHLASYSSDSDDGAVLLILWAPHLHSNKTVYCLSEEHSYFFFKISQSWRLQFSFLIE